MSRRFTLFKFFSAALVAVYFGLVPCSAADEPISVQTIDHAGARYRVVLVDTEKAKLRLYWQKPDGKRFGSLVNLKTWFDTRGERMVFATNAGIFRPGFIPGGLHVEDGNELVKLNLRDGDGNFHLKPNGVFYLKADGAHVVKSEDYHEAATDVLLATQSGPLLVMDGALHPAFRAGSESRRVRSGVGVRSGTEVYFAISREQVSFHDIATLFRDVLECRNALYLDGDISSFYVPGEIENFGLMLYAGMIAATTPRNLVVDQQ